MYPAPEIAKDTVLRARLGDASAFRTIVEGLSRLTFNIAYRMVYNATDAEDLTQEVFLRLHRNLDKYDPSYPFMPWFRTLASHVCINWRKQQPKAASLDAMEVDPAGAQAEEPRDPSALLKREIDKLPPEYKMVLSYLYFEGLSVADISAAMNVPTGTVKTWLFRAREHLKEKLKPHVATLL